MFDYISGKLISKSPTFLIVETAGIGYYISIPLSTYDNIPAKGDVKVFTQLFIREEIVTLFGFSSTEEREIFKLLISVSGIGPKIALAILSGSPLSQLKDSIVSEDTKTLSSIKGIGKKTAERLILELKESIKSVDGISKTAGKIGKSQLYDDAIAALISLGFTRPTAEKAIDKALKVIDIAEDNIEALIRHALQNT